MTDVVGLRFVTEGEEAALRALNLYRRGLIETGNIQEKHVNTINRAIERELSVFQNAQRIREQSTRQETQRIARQTQMMERSQRAQEQALNQSVRSFVNSQKIKERALREEQEVQQRSAAVSQAWTQGLNQNLGVTGQRATELGATFSRLNEVQRNLEATAVAWTTTANQNLGVTGQRATELGATFSRLNEVQRNIDATATAWTANLNRNLGVTGQRATELGATFTRLAEVQRNLEAGARQWTGALNERLGVTGQRATELGATFSALEDRQRRAAEQFKQLQASIDPAVAAQQRYAEAERRVTAAIDQGIVSKERGRATLAAYRLQLNDLSRTTIDAETLSGRLRNQFLATANTIAILDGPLGGVASRFSAFGVLLGRTGLLLGATAVAFTALSVTIGRSIGDMARAETSMLSLQAVIDATGGVTARAASDIEAMSRRLARATLFDREDFRSAARQVLTFGNIAGTTFDRVLELSGDLAFTFGTQVPAAAQQLARALNDPRQNLTALTRSYGLLTREQRNQVVALQEQGRLLEAQATILEIVESRISGVASAAGTGLAGAIDTAGESLADFRTRLAEATGAGDSYRRALVRVAESLDSLTASLPAIINGFTIFRDVVIALAATRLPALIAVTYGWAAAAVSGATATGVLTAAVVRLNAAVMFLGGPVGIAIAAGAGLFLLARRMQESRDPAEQAARATETYTAALQTLINEKGRDAATNVAAERLREKETTLQAAEAALTLAESRAAAATSDPYGASLASSQLELAARRVQELRAEIEGLRGATDTLGLNMGEGVRLTVVQMQQLVRLAQVEREERERVAELAEARLRTLGQEIELSQTILRYGEDSVQAEAVRLRQGEENLRLALQQEGVYGDIAEEIVAAWRQQQSLTREIQAATASANNLANAFSGVSGAIAGARQRMVGLNAQLAAARAGMSPGEAAAMGTVAQVRAAARAEAESVGGPHAGIIPPRVQQDLRELEALELEAARVQNAIAEVFRGSTAGGGGGGGASENVVDIMDTVRALEQRIDRERQLVGLTREARAEREILFQLQDANDNADIQMSAQRLQQVAAELAANQELLELEKERQSQLENIANTIENSMERAFMSIVDGTATAKDAFRNMARTILAELYRVLVVQQLVGQFQQGGGGILGALAGGFGGANANGNAFAGGNVIPFANGGVVNRPTTFPMSGGRTGLMGEAGPEAIMPLRRGKDGKLGITAEGGGTVVNQTFSFNLAANGDDSVKRIVAQAAPQIVEAAKSGVLDARRRGGSFRAAFG